jgi:hypothetical protein
MLNADKQVIGQNRNKQVGFGPPGNLMVNRPHPEACLQRSERSLYMGESHVAPPNIYGSHLFMAGFDDITPVYGSPFLFDGFFDNR